MHRDRAVALKAGSHHRWRTAAGKAALEPQPLDDEAFWRGVRSQFAFRDSAVPMNAANLCPSFRAVTDTLKQLTADIDVDCSFQNRAKFTNLLEQCRSRLAGQLGVSSDDLALVRNTSEANNIINNGLPLESGDEVLIWDENHPTNNVAWDVRAARFGLKVVRVTVPATLHSETELLEAFTQRFSDRTRVLTVSHVSNVMVSGCRSQHSLK